MPRKKTGGRTKGTLNKLTEKANTALVKAFLELQKEHETSLLTWCKGDWNKYYTIMYKLALKEVPDQPPLLLNLTTGLPPTIAVLEKELAKAKAKKAEEKRREEERELEEKQRKLQARDEKSGKAQAQRNAALQAKIRELVEQIEQLDSTRKYRTLYGIGYATPINYLLEDLRRLSPSALKEILA